MVLLYVLLVVLFLVPSKWYLKSFNDGYLDKNSILPIKGIFVVFVFFSHFRSYVVLPDHWLNNYFTSILDLIGQLMVTMFLFYSGYGIMKSLQIKGETYVKGFFLRRFVPVFFQFVTAILLFVIMNACLGIHYDWQTILFSFTGWESIGNSNWYIFIVFALYILFILVFLIPKLSVYWKNVIHTVLSVGLVALLYFVKEGSWWWNTVLCFNLGMWYCLFKDRIDALMKKPLAYWITLPVTLGLFVLFYVLQYKGIYPAITFIVAALIFCLLVVLITMKVQSKNMVLSFLGKHVFSIYILQRLVFIPLSKTALLDMEYLFFFVALAITIVVSFAFDFCHGWVHKKYIGLLDSFGKKSRETSNQ